MSTSKKTLSDDKKTEKSKAVSKTDKGKTQSAKEASPKAKDKSVKKVSEKAETTKTGKKEVKSKVSQTKATKEEKEIKETKTTSKTTKLKATTKKAADKTADKVEDKEVKTAKAQAKEVKPVKAAKAPKAPKADKTPKAKADTLEKDNQSSGEMDEDAQERFKVKLKELLALAKKKKNVLEYDEISDQLSELNLNEDQLDSVLEVLEKSGIDVLRMSEDVDDIPVDDEDIDLDDEEEVDMENIDLSVPDGVSIEDPVRMYLKEIGKVPLLNADQEIVLAQDMENGMLAERVLKAQDRSSLDLKDDEKELTEEAY